MGGILSCCFPSLRSTRGGGIAVPLYVWPPPVSDAWENVAKASEIVDVVVVNPRSGPSTSPVHGFQLAVADCQAKNKRVIGYIRSIYATRELHDVIAEMQRYREWYCVDGFFIDEVTWGEVGFQFYREVSKAAYKIMKSIRCPNGPLLVFNPGCHVLEQYMPLADVFVVFENSAEEYMQFEVRPYTRKYPSKKYWHMIHTVEPSQMSALLQKFESSHAGWLYATHLKLPNPYNELPLPAMWRDAQEHFLLSHGNTDE